ncbi:MAG: HAD-IA family hydrolase [Acidobacteria bacterium]|nr:HAD-IA family hydrolase [Acidobacteriota bacterium]
MRYQTIFLDAGGVLVCPNWDRAAETLGRHGVRVEAATLAAAEPAVKRQLDVAHTVRATNDEQRGFLYFDLILKRAGISPTARSDAALAELKVFHDRENTWDAMPGDVIPALRRLKGAGFRVVVVSNTSATLRRAFSRLGIEPFIDLVIASDEERVEKPDPRLFHIALERAGADPATTIHCGDLYEIDIVGARAAGLPAVLLDSAGVYNGVDCPRVASMTELMDGLLAGRFDSEGVGAQ